MEWDIFTSCKLWLWSWCDPAAACLMFTAKHCTVISGGNCLTRRRRASITTTQQARRRFGTGRPMLTLYHSLSCRLVCLHWAFTNDVTGTVRSFLSVIFSELELRYKFAICYCRSVCRLFVCRLSITLVCPTQPLEIFSNYSLPSGTLAIHWHSLKTPLSGDLNARGVAKYSDFWHLECYNSETEQDRR